MVNVSNRDRLASIPPLPGSSGAPQTAVTYGPTQGSQTYSLDQFRSTPGAGVGGTGDGRVTSSDRTKAKLAPIARSGDNQAIYAEHLARARQMGYLTPGSTDRRRVIALQQKLNAVGISVPVSGTFEYSTSQAVRNFKSRVGLNDGFVDKQGNFAVSDVMTPEAENALSQLATQAGWKPTGPLTDKDATPGWNKSPKSIPQLPGSQPTTPGYPTGAAGGAAVTPEEYARYQHLQQIAKPRAQGGNGYALTADQRRFYEDVRQRLIANGGVVGAPTQTTAPTGPANGNDPMALLRQQLNHDGPVSPAEVAAADAFEAAITANPNAFDNQPGIMVINFQAIRARQQQFGVQGAAGTQGAGQGASTTYTVKQGDTFESIAKALTGDANNAQAIYDANKDRLAEWQAQRPQMTKQFNDYYKTTMVPNPYLLPKGFQLTIPGAGSAPDAGDVSAPASNKTKTTNPGTTAPAGTLKKPSAAVQKQSSAPGTTWSSDAVDMAQYQWFQAKRDAYSAGTLSDADKQAFEWIANKGPVTAELDEYLQKLQKGGGASDVGGAPGTGGRNSMTVDINDPDEDLQAALAILKKQQAGQTITPEERQAYKALMSKYKQKTMDGN